MAAQTSRSTPPATSTSPATHYLRIFHNASATSPCNSPPPTNPPTHPPPPSPSPHPQYRTRSLTRLSRSQNGRVNYPESSVNVPPRQHQRPTNPPRHPLRQHPVTVTRLAPKSSSNSLPPPTLHLDAPTQYRAPPRTLTNPPEDYTYLSTNNPSNRPTLLSHRETTGVT